jgi:hypothetical protein
MVRWAGGAMAALVMAACAANPGSDEIDGTDGSGDVFVHVVVENERAFPQFLRVYLVPPTGAEIGLGTTSTLGTDTLVARGRLPPGRYTLRAIGARNHRLPEQTVQLRGGETLYWNLRNHLLVQQDP